jgi:ribosomal protein S18 acetylase RimI-like enzyme
VVEIRDAREDEFDELGDIRVQAYLADGFLSPESTYAVRLRMLGADGLDHVLVAVQADMGQADTGKADTSRPNVGHPDPITAGECGPAAENGGEPRRIVGTVMLQGWPQGGEILAGPEEAEIRALAVSPEARDGGVGRALLAAVIERAAREGIRHLVLLTLTEMKAAHHLYEEAGFSRLPERDWSPEPGVTLLAYGLVLESDQGGDATCR